MTEAITFEILDADIGPATPFCPTERALVRTLGLDLSFDVVMAVVSLFLGRFG